jgi:hypothetical protein
MRNYLPRIGRYHLILAASLAATPSFAADPDQGETLARRWCTGCHLVATDQKAATTDAPPFASIARRPDFDPAKIEFFLRDPHPKMPNMTLSRAGGYRGLYRDAEINVLAKYFAPQICLNLEPEAATYIPEAVKSYGRAP